MGCSASWWSHQHIGGVDGGDLCCCCSSSDQHIFDASSLNWYNIFITNDLFSRPIGYQLCHPSGHFLLDSTAFFTSDILCTNGAEYGILGTYNLCTTGTYVCSSASNQHVCSRTACILTSVVCVCGASPHDAELFDNAG